MKLPTNTYNNNTMIIMVYQSFFWFCTHNFVVLYFERAHFSSCFLIGVFRDKWQKRYFVLHGAWIYYFKKYGVRIHVSLYFFVCALDIGQIIVSNHLCLVHVELVRIKIWIRLDRTRCGHGTCTILQHTLKPLIV